MSTQTVGYSMEEAVQLIADIGGYDPVVEAEDLLAEADTPEMFDKFLQRRINDHIPVAYMTNHARFRGLDLYIDERVLIPRSETEPLVQIAVEELPLGASVVDVGTGSGAVALAVKNERRDLKVTGVDVSKDALDVASINSEKLDLYITLKDADLLEGVKGNFDCVLANLPYLPTKKRDSYAPEMTEHEPSVALWGGEDGFDLTRRLLAQVQRRDGVELVAFESGLGQETDLAELIRSHGFPIVYCTTDSRGDVRCVIGKKR
jgi:release factor glutamine methyltransferase